MIRKNITEREAAEMWVEGFNALPTVMIEKLVRLDGEDWKEVTVPSCGCEVRVRERALPYSYNGGETEGEIIGYDEKSGLYRVELDDGVKISVMEGDFENSRSISLPMWGRMWAFNDNADILWLTIGGGIELMSKCGFRIYKSQDFGYFFGIDASGCDFYEAFWIPLYRARGMQWHDPAMEMKEVA